MFWKNGIVISEFDLKPTERVMLYRNIFGMSNVKIRETRWYRMCGRKVMFRTEQEAQANIGHGNDGEVQPYCCPFYPKPHYHLGHQATHLREKASEFGKRIRDYFLENNLTELYDQERVGV
jgi:hypothetical protein